MLMSFLKKIVGGGPSIDMKALVKDGAMIVDVRTKEEFKAGHIAGAINIPLNNLPTQLSAIPKNKVIITCCASGMRSASAKNLLKSKGYEAVHNGGGWMGLQNKIR